MGTLEDRLHQDMVAAMKARDWASDTAKCSASSV